MIITPTITTVVTIGPGPSTFHTAGAAEAGMAVAGMATGGVVEMAGMGVA